MLEFKLYQLTYQSINQSLVKSNNIDQVKSYQGEFGQVKDIFLILLFALFIPPLHKKNLHNPNK